ncbi:MAG: TIGR04283 family arsenosugar biosynthesis glycosyltransferase [Planctomycetaceae bacterium]
MKISIIIPALNEEQNIRRCVERARGLKPSEVLVVDGGSTDSTRSIATGLDCQLIESPPGRSVQQNLGAAASTGDILLFLHADCWLPPQATVQMQRILRSPDIPGGAFYQCIEQNGSIFRALEAGNALRVCCTRIAFGDQGIFLRRDVFDRLGGFPPTPLMEDVLLMRKVHDVGRLALLPGPLHVDARRWEKHGPIRQTLRNWLLLTAERLGIPASQLVRFYLPHWKRNP